MVAVAKKMDRGILMDTFIAAQGIGDYRRVVVAGDASFRRYERVITGDATLIVMDAPPQHEDTQPFLAVSELLQRMQLSSPQVIAQDTQHGFLLLEDLGDNLFSRHLRVQPDDEHELYSHAIDALVHIQQNTPKHAVLKPYDEAVYMREVALLGEWFLPTVSNNERAREQLAAEYMQIWRDILARAPLTQHCMILRDYHADNLIWLPHRTGVQRVGLLDYQDALIGDAAYDLVSLLEDARRDVSPSTVQAMIERFVSASGVSRDRFEYAYAVLGAQRNCKIIGIFHRLNQRDGKAQYLDYLPRVWEHLQGDLKHPALYELEQWFERIC